MNLYGDPVLKIRTKDRLHITKEPGFVSWATIMLLTSIGLMANYYLIPDYFNLLALFLCLCLVLSLNFMETWDFIMDKEENLVTLVNRSWYHGFSMKVPEENVKRFPLSSITSVTPNFDFGIDIKKSDGTCTTIKSKQHDFRSIGKLRREIATFLHLERIEYMKGTDKIYYNWDIDPWSHVWLDTQETDTDSQSSIAEQETQYEYGRNIKVIKGPS